MLLMIKLLKSEKTINFTRKKKELIYIYGRCLYSRGIVSTKTIYTIILQSDNLTGIDLKK